MNPTYGFSESEDIGTTLGTEAADEGTGFSATALFERAGMGSPPGTGVLASMFEQRVASTNANKGTSARKGCIGN